MSTELFDDLEGGAAPAGLALQALIVYLRILFEDLGRREDHARDQLGAGGADGMDGRPGKIEGRVGRNGVGDGALEGFIGGEERPGGWDRDEDDGADSLVQATEKGWIEASVAGEKRRGRQGSRFCL